MATSFSLVRGHGTWPSQWLIHMFIWKSLPHDVCSLNQIYWGLTNGWRVLTRCCSVPCSGPGLENVQVIDRHELQSPDSGWQRWCEQQLVSLGWQGGCEQPLVRPWLTGSVWNRCWSDLGWQRWCEQPLVRPWMTGSVWTTIGHILQTLEI